MTETTIVIEEQEAAEPVIVETPSESDVEPVVDALVELHEATNEHREESVEERLAHEAHRAELERENAELKAAAAFELGRRVEEEQRPPVEEVAAPIIEDDEVIAPQTHGWFRPMSEWREK